MSEDSSKASPAPRETLPPRPAGRRLSPAAERALAEAEIRRRAASGEAAARPREINGRSGPEPTRFGDWEKNGIVSDF